MNYRVGPKGQVVIPKPIRDEIGLAPGDEVDFSLHGDQVVLRPSKSSGALRGRFRGLDLTGTLLADRAADRAREQSR
ncbi:MAG: AbrB/MazE/SpoVT family DNA-binding domain-containing protein [Actinobacteria bacterium]|nr:AbrB/MazE/SpoVT family DNA-binding domain-containing protein [Actinomycetota bacterium]